MRPSRAATPSRLPSCCLKKFGSFAEVVHAPEARLREVDGVKDASINQLKLIAAAAARIAKGEIKRSIALSSWNDVIDYCRSSMAFADKEQFRLLFLDKRNQLIADEVQQIGTIDHTPVYPREVIKRALELSATALILVHNHPTHPLLSRWITLKHAETLQNCAFFALRSGGGFGKLGAVKGVENGLPLPASDPCFSSTDPSSGKEETPCPP